LKLNNSAMKLLIKLISKFPFSYKLARWLPIKVNFSVAEKRVLWRTLESDVQQLEDYLGQSLNQWRSQYMYKEGGRL